MLMLKVGIKSVNYRQYKRKLHDLSEKKIYPKDNTANIPSKKFWVLKILLH